MDWILTVQTKSCIAKPLQKNVYTIETNNGWTCKEDENQLLSKVCRMTEDSVVLRPEPVVGCYVQFQTGLEHNQMGMEFRFETWKRENSLPAGETPPEWIRTVGILDQKVKHWKMRWKRRQMYPSVPWKATGSGPSSLEDAHCSSLRISPSTCCSRIWRHCLTEVCIRLEPGWGDRNGTCTPMDFAEE